MVAMCEHDWNIFQQQISAEANERLTVVLESFCEYGDVDLPPSCFRWFMPTDDDPVGVEMGAFEAKGVVLHGRRAVNTGGDAFFVTKITLDAQLPPNGGRRGRARDDRQRDLPFEQTDAGGGAQW